MFRASSAHLQEDIVAYMQHMVPSLSIRVPGGLSEGAEHCGVISVLVRVKVCVRNGGISASSESGQR